MAGKRPEGGVAEKVRPTTRLQKPPLYRVILHNDDYTTMEFVVEVLETIFHKSQGEAHALMLKVHLHGAAQCGVYTYEIAETKVTQVHDLAQHNGFPLRASLEKE